MEELLDALRHPHDGEARITCESGARLTISWGQLLAGSARLGDKWMVMKVQCHNRRPRLLSFCRRTPEQRARASRGLYYGVMLVDILVLIDTYGGIKSWTIVQ